MTDIARTYLDTWNATDPDERADRLASGWSESATYVDPLAQVQGHGELDGLIAAVHAQFPGFVFSQLGETEAHHTHARFRWGLGPAGAPPVVEGSDVVVTDDAGHLVSVVGFLDVVPAQA